jgi:tripartite-type tricarboxylate transporter receptor subunit TctC
MNRPLKSAICISFLLLSKIAYSDEWPSKTIKIVQGFSAAAATQVVAQEVGESLKKSYGATFYVEAKPGAGGNIASETVAKAAPDGYTLLEGSSGTHTINPTLYKSLPFDVKTSFEPITLLVDVSNVLIVPKDSPFNNLKELLIYARANPKNLNYGSSGNGTSMHLAGEQFKYATDVDIVHVPFRESSHALTALMGGQIQLTFHQFPAVIQQIKAGAVKPLAITSAKRNPLIPDVPTVAESGFPNFESITWFALFAPAKTPKTIINKINLSVTEELKGEAGKKLQSIGLSPRPSTPEELAAVMLQDTQQWKKVIDRVGAKLD